jgi:hypothetical protein
VIGAPGMNVPPNGTHCHTPWADPATSAARATNASAGSRHTVAAPNGGSSRGWARLGMESLNGMSGGGDIQLTGRPASRTGLPDGRELLLVRQRTRHKPRFSGHLLVGFPHG